MSERSDALHGTKSARQVSPCSLAADFTLNADRIERTRSYDGAGEAARSSFEASLYAELGASCSVLSDTRAVQLQQSVRWLVNHTDA